MRIGTMALLALTAVTVSLYAEEAHSEDQSAGEVIGDIVEQQGREVARGVAVAADAGADTLDGLTYSGCTLAKWAVGERRDRTPSVGNSIVALVFRLPVSLIGGTVCATSAVLAMPTKGIGYGFDQLASAGESSESHDSYSPEDRRRLKGMTVEDLAKN